MNIRKLISVPSRRGVALAVAVLSLGVAIGAGASATLSTAENDAATAALALRTAGVRSALDTTFQRYADTMHDLVAAAATQPGGTLAPTVTRLVGERLPGAHEVLIVGADDAVITQHAVDSSTPPPQRVLTREPGLARALHTARQSGRLIVTGAHVLTTDLDLPPAHRQPAFEIVAPVHAGVSGFVGWVIVSVRAPDLLAAALRGADVTGVATTMVGTSADGARHEVAHWSSGGTATGRRAATVDVALGGHTWQILVRPTTALIGPARAAADTVILLAGILVGLLLAGLVLSLVTSRERAMARVTRAVHDRRTDLERAQRAEATLRERETDLAEREAELTGFAAVAGENLHIPLSNIAGFTDLLIEEAGPQFDEASRGFLHRIARSTDKMRTLVNELLVYTTATEAALRLEPVDTARLTMDVVAERIAAGPGSGSGFAERPSVDVGDLPVVTADAALLRQILDQLVGNALRYVRRGSAARITVSAHQDDNDWWRIEVADRGIGVPEEHRNRIFAPFHRAPAAEGYPGNGLGLAICRRAITLHGGTIGVRANPGGGSVFFFTVAGIEHPADLPDLPGVSRGPVTAR